MNAPGNILIDYREGLITCGEAVTAIAQQIVAENVAEVMSALPEAFRKELVGWAMEWSPEGRVILRGNLLDEEAREITERLGIAGAAIKEWSDQRHDECSANAEWSNGRQIANEEISLTDH